MGTGETTYYRAVKPQRKPTITNRIQTLIAALMAFLCTALTGGAQATTPALSPALAATRAALEKYQDPMVAVRDGYYSTVSCMDFKGDAHGGAHSHGSKPGAMGVHFLNTATIGPVLDSLKPQVLIYEPVGDKLKLVAAEWLMPTAIAKTAPVIFGQTLIGPMAGHPPVMPEALEHYDLHVWLWKANPEGMFASTNSAVHCPKGGYNFTTITTAPKQSSLRY